MSAHDEVEALKRAVAAITRAYRPTAGQRWREMFGGGLGGFHQGAFRAHAYAPDPAASERARALLNRLMTPTQREEYRNTGRFTEAVGGVLYRLGRGIEVLGDTGEVVETWCTYPLGLCIEDVYIAQLLHLRSSPAALRSQANVISREPRGSPIPVARLHFLLRRPIPQPTAGDDRELWHLLGSGRHTQLRSLYEAMRLRDPKPESPNR